MGALLAAMVACLAAPASASDAAFFGALTRGRAELSMPGFRLGGAAQAPPILEPAAAAIVGPLLSKTQASGAVVAFVSGGGIRVLGFGETAAGSGRAPDGDTVYQIGSLTKLFTGLALADMVGRGQVGLDDPIETLLPPGTRVPEFSGKKITLRHLANHVSGLPRMPSNFNPADPLDPYADYDAGLLYAFLASHALASEPGAKAEYSNVGAGLLGHALAFKAGVSVDELLERRVCAPLGMTDTFARLDASRQARLAPGYYLGQEVPPWTFSALGGAGALRSTADDMSRFVSAQLGLSATPLASAIAKTHQDALFWQAAPIAGGFLLGHCGGTFGHQACLVLDTAASRGVILLLNAGPLSATDDSASQAALELFGLP